MPSVILHRLPIHIDHSRQACGLEQSWREVQHVFDHRFCFDIDDAPTPTFPRFTIMNEFPTEIGGYFVARATLTGPIVIDVKTIKELIESEREAFEDRDELAERMIESDRVHGFSILGIYKSYEEATAALDWVRAWRQGS